MLHLCELAVPRDVKEIVSRVGTAQHGKLEYPEPGKEWTGPGVSLPVLSSGQSHKGYSHLPNLAGL